MCGIICYVGRENATPILLEGLQLLEYRGYDSSGIAVINNLELNVIKKKGRIAELLLHPEIKNIKGTIGIAHTRWATHGEPNDINSHPHKDCTGDIAIIHNGIIENYQTLKKILENENHNFESETDSEIIAHLVEKFYDGNLKDAVKKTLDLIEGTFGIAAIHKNHDEIIIARRGSPLVIGIGKDFTLAASDATALLNHTRRVIYLQDDELAILKDKSCTIEDFSGNKKNNTIEDIKWSLDQVEKNGYKHFMLKEIMEQSNSISNGLRGRIKDNKIKLTINTDVTKISRIVIVACGTSWHSALIGKYFLEHFTKLHVEVDYASEFRYRNPLIDENDLVIAISQSGETADTLAAIKEAKKRGAKTLGIINVVGSTIAREVDSGIYLHAGPEIGVASTKAFTSQLTALLLLSLYIKQEKQENLDSKLLNEIMNLPTLVTETLKCADFVKDIANQIKSSKNFIFLGREINFPVALEGALKLKEISYIHAEGYPAAEMKHGPIALIDSEMPVVFIATKNELSDKILSNIQEVKARKGKIILIMNDNDPNLEKFVDYKIIIPHTIKELTPIINVIPLQLLAYYVADLKGLDVDKPRNLAKSVTVE
ncbi:MAG: glutamine--fructose-6-phosphate transaminase (isomerizing) [Candidatus Woesearchaeota archaeon]|jgi:glucosamine--fructose-6-phosphate aminotransferase (isomerizing)